MKRLSAQKDAQKAAHQCRTLPVHISNWECKLTQRKCYTKTLLNALTLIWQKLLHIVIVIAFHWFKVAYFPRFCPREILAISSSKHLHFWLVKNVGKRVFNYCQTSILFFTNGGILSGYSSLLALHLSGTPSLKTGTSPLAVSSSTTVYTCVTFFLNIFPLPESKSSQNLQKRGKTAKKSYFDKQMGGGQNIHQESDKTDCDATFLNI